MRETPDGLRPEPGFLAEQMSQMSELTQTPMPEFEIVEYEPVIDSSNMLPQDWLKIARDIEQRYANFAGFVVIHGTDTMAYTASALPFMLGPIAKPVILTGSPASTFPSSLRRARKLEDSNAPGRQSRDSRSLPALWRSTIERVSFDQVECRQL